MKPSTQDLLYLLAEFLVLTVIGLFGPIIMPWYVGVASFLWFLFLFPKRLHDALLKRENESP